MSDKAEMTRAAARVLVELANSSGLDWEQAAFRFQRMGAAPALSQCAVRHASSLHTVPGSRQYITLLERLMDALFSTSRSPDGEAPLVAVIVVDPARRFHLKFDYRDPAAFAFEDAIGGAAHHAFAP